MHPNSVARGAAARGFAFTMQTSRTGFGVSLSTAPFLVSLVTWTRRSEPRPYILRGRTAKVGPFTWLRLRERTPSAAP